MQNVSNDVLCVLVGFSPGDLDGGGGQGMGLHLAGGAGEPVGPQHRQPGASLGRASTVLSNALVDRLVILANAIYGQRAVAGRRGRRWRERR